VPKSKSTKSTKTKSFESRWAKDVASHNKAVATHKKREAAGEKARMKRLGW
jgi:hypothetical protein